jgi:hypothetical protein
LFSVRALLPCAEELSGEERIRMAAWRFFQGLRNEWRWYRFDEGGVVIGESDQGFAELRGCMANAESAGFKGDAYQVHARQQDDEHLIGSPHPLAAFSTDSEKKRS